MHNKLYFTVRINLWIIITNIGINILMSEQMRENRSIKLGESLELQVDICLVLLGNIFLLVHIVLLLVMLLTILRRGASILLQHLIIVNATIMLRWFFILRFTIIRTFVDICLMILIFRLRPH